MATITVNANMSFSEINKAISGAASGDTIFLSPGTYHSRTKDDRIIISKSNLKLVGAGKTTIIHGHAGGACVQDKSTRYAYIMGSGVSNIDISNIWFNSDATSDPDTRGHYESRRAFYFQNGSNITVHHCGTLGYMYLDIVTASKVNGIYMHDCYIPYHGHAAFYTSYCTKGRAWNNYIVLYTNACLRSYASSNIEFDHNILRGGAGGQAGWEFQGNVSGTNIHHNIIYNLPYPIVQSLGASGSVNFSNNVYWSSGSIQLGSGTGNIANPSDRDIAFWRAKGYGVPLEEPEEPEEPDVEEITEVDFTTNVVSGKFPLKVQFTSTVKGGKPTEYLWIFEPETSKDYCSKHEVTAGHTFNSPGKYTVSLTVKNSKSSKTITKENYITVTDGVVQTPTEIIVAVDGSGDFNCDGTDDQIEVNAAIAMAGAKKLSQIRLKLGNYKFSNAIIPLSGVRIIADPGTVISYI